MKVTLVGGAGGIGSSVAFNLLLGGNRNKQVAAQDTTIETKVEEEEKAQNFENPDVGLDPNLPTNYNIDRIEDVSVPGNVKPDEAVGNNMGEGPVQNLPPPPGLGGSPTITSTASSSAASSASRRTCLPERSRRTVSTAVTRP